VEGFNGRRTDAQRFGPGGAVGIFINDIKINYLNKYGIDFDIIDKNTHSTTWSKALSVSPATIKAFQYAEICGFYSKRRLTAPVFPGRSVPRQGLSRGRVNHWLLSE
jgi:hypothetical protein